MGASKRQSEDTATPVFGLTRAQLLPIVENVAGEPVAWFDLSIEHEPAPEHYGGRGEKAIPTFGYRTRRGRVGRATVFAKRHCNIGPNEALHYEWLTKHGAPSPRIYGAISGAEVRDIVFIEYIEPFLGDEEELLRDDDVLAQFLSVTARFNAIRPCAEYAGKLPCKLAWMGFDRLAPTLERFWERAARGEAGEEVKRLCSEDELERLAELAGRVTEPIARMKQALSHWDHRPHNVGWRRQTGEMVIFDLEDTMMGPRFDDLADWLGAPDEAQQRSRPREELAACYLEQLERWGGAPAQVGEFLEETRVLWMLHALGGLDWWLRYGGVLDGCETPAGKNPAVHRCRNRAKLWRELHGLMGAAASWMQ